MEERKKIYAFRHLGQEHLGSFGPVLREAGYDIEIVVTPVDEINEKKALEADILFVTGGPISVTQENDYPFIKQEIEILEKRLAAGQPNFGICLGAQILAKALGSNVYKGGAGEEIGWLPLKITDEGKKTAMHHFDEAHTSMLHWHGDTFDLPKNATLLASSDKYENQVFSYDKSIAFQCHPEITERQLKEWAVLFVGQVTGENAALPIDQLRADSAKYAHILQEQSHKFLLEWIKSIA